MSFGRTGHISFSPADTLPAANKLHKSGENHEQEDHEQEDEEEDDHRTNDNQHHIKDDVT
jgi:hypothetical protein